MTMPDGVDAPELLVGAYAIAPPFSSDDEEKAWYEDLAGIPGVGGLEAPFTAGFHRSGTRRFTELVPAGWRISVTLLPLTMAGLRADSRYGLASTDDAGRAAAVHDMRRLRMAVEELEDIRGEECVTAVQLVSAPRTRDGGSSVERFAESLETVAGWGWSARLLIEHCDAPRSPLHAEKGFLSLDEEREVAHAVSVSTGTRVDHWINWGRSAIEGRSAMTPQLQIESLVRAGTLGGVCFSGASAVPTPRGDAWRDVHNAPTRVDPTSLLTDEAITAATAALAGAPGTIVAVKVQDPADHPTAASRRDALARAVAAVRAQWAVEPSARVRPT